MKVLAAVTLCAFLVPAVSAHSTSNEASESSSVGGLHVSFDTRPTPVAAGKPFLATISLSLPDFSPARGLTVSVRAAGAEHPAPEGLPGTYVARLAFRESGRYDLTWSFPDVNGTRTTWDASVNVYTDLGVRVVPADEAADVYANRSTRLGILLLNVTTGEPDSRVQDVRLRLERWSDDHEVMKGADEVDATSAKGAWWADVVVPEPGMLRVKIASRSLGMGFEDQPYLQQYVLPDDLAPAPAARNESPSVAFALLATAFTVVSILVRRRP